LTAKFHDERNRMRRRKLPSESASRAGRAVAACMSNAIVIIEWCGRTALPPVTVGIERKRVLLEREASRAGGHSHSEPSEHYRAV
jgi:hypothetical protein